MEGLALLALAAFSFFFVVAPLLIYATQSVTIRASWAQTTPEDLMAGMQDFVRVLVHQFIALGFEFRCNVHLAGAMPGVHGFQVLLVHPTTSEIAVLLIARGSMNLQSLVFAIRSEYADGTWISTGCNPGIGIFPPDPNHRYENFPWVHDAGTMCAAHRRLVAAAGRAAEPAVAPAPGQELGHMDQEGDRSNRWHTACGYRYVDHERGVLYFTLWGAFLSTWKLMAPIKQIRIGLRNRKSLRVWEKLGM